MHRLFMQDSESPRTIYRLLMLIVGIVLTLIMADFGLRVTLPSLTIEPPFILRLQNVLGVQKLWDFAAESVKPIVFTGSSQLYSGISPVLFNERVKTISGKDVSSLTITIAGAVVTIQRDLIRNLIIPKQPELIIYAIEMRALQSSVQNGVNVKDFRNKPLGYAVASESNIERGLLLWLLEHSNLMRYRDNIREWLTGIRPINQLDYAPTLADEFGFFHLPQAPLDRTPDTIKNNFAPFTATADIRQLLADIETACNQSSIPCLLLNMPIDELAYTYITPETEREYQRVLHETGLPIWDFNTNLCRSILGDDSFYNLNHLNEKGAERLSPMVADVYLYVFFDVPIQGDANCATISS